MKLLAVSDAHVHQWSAFSRLDENGVNTRLKDTLDSLWKAREVAVKERVDLVIFAGDLFHTTKIDADTLALTGHQLEEFGQLGVHILGVEGNHDQASRVRELTSTSALRVPKNWKWLRGESITIKGYTIWGAPFGHMEPPPFIPDIAVIHRGIQGAQISDYFQSPFERDLDPKDAASYATRLVIAGHYHKPQYIEGAVPILIPGAPLQHTWGDEGQDRGVWLVEILDDTVRPKFIPFDFPRFIRAKSVQDLANAAADFITVESEDERVIEASLSDGLRQKARGISIQAPKASVIAVADRIQVGSNVEGAIRDYARRFGKDRADELERLGLEILKEARV